MEDNIAALSFKICVDITESISKFKRLEDELIVYEVKPDKKVYGYKNILYQREYIDRTILKGNYFYRK